ncbi:MAG: hypothetical protein FWE28_03170 [Oscillospiraceae bacterium]|nr:hypothetical protein [Oscillospiraceae bacterium]
MKRKLLIILLAVLLLAGCGTTPPSDTVPAEEEVDVVEIVERFFSTQIHSIMLNRDEYLGRTLRYEGLFRSVHWPPTDRYYHYVLRLTEDCCSPGGVIGFEVQLAAGMEPLEHNAWVLAEGVLEEYVAEDGITYLRLALTSLEELEERGEEFVPGIS